jgi:hypothetical protein
MEVEGCTYADEDGSVQSAHMGGHPVFLFGSTEANPYDVRFGRVDLVNHLLVFPWRKFSEGRRVSADDPESRKTLFETETEFVRYRVVASVKKVFVRRRHGSLAHRQHQIGAVNPSHLTIPSPTADPNERDPVWGGEASAVDQVPETRIPLALHHRMDVAETDIVRSPALDPRPYHVNRIFQVDGTDAHTEDVHPLRESPSAHRRASRQRGVGVAVAHGT